MSDTPRTDAFDREHGFAYASEAIKFAELLERENAALRLELKYGTDTGAPCAELARLTRIVGWLENSAPLAIWRVQETGGAIQVSICAMDDELNTIGTGRDLCSAVEDAIAREGRK